MAEKVKWVGAGRIVQVAGKTAKGGIIVLNSSGERFRDQIREDLS